MPSQFEVVIDQREVVVPLRGVARLVSQVAVGAVLALPWGFYREMSHESLGDKP